MSDGRAMLGNLGGQPVLILPEGTMRTRGTDAQKNNIAAAKAVADAVRSTLGPKGMDKMLVDSIGDIVITNDGVTILEEMEIEHPSAKMMVEVAKTQNEEVGDGTTTSVIIAGELLKKAEELLEQEIHPTVITKGFKIAKDEALKILEEIGIPVKLSDTETLKKIAITAMSGKSVEKASPKLADLVVVTAEDPRGELQIINKQILSGLKSKESVFVIDDRQKAIEYAINKLAQKGDTVGIFGKGHENSMNIDGKSEIPWSDFKAVKKAYGE